MRADIITTGGCCIVYIASGHGSCSARLDATSRPTTSSVTKTSPSASVYHDFTRPKRTLSGLCAECEAKAGRVTNTCSNVDFSSVFRPPCSCLSSISYDQLLASSYCSRVKSISVSDKVVKCHRVNKRRKDSDFTTHRYFWVAPSSAPSPAKAVTESCYGSANGRLHRASSEAVLLYDLPDNLPPQCRCALSRCLHNDHDPNIAEYCTEYCDHDPVRSLPSSNSEL